MTLFISFILIMSVFSNHPLALILALIMTVTMLAIKTYIIMKMSLISYTIILVLLGGLIILFIYMASLAPNEPFNLKKLSYIALMALIMYIFLEKLNESNNFPTNYTFKIDSMMLHPIWITFIMSYLLITLVAVVKLTESKQGPLRSMI